MQTLQNAYQSLLNLFIINANNINASSLSVNNLSLPLLTPSLPLLLDANDNVISNSINLASNQVSGILPLTKTVSQVEYITGTTNEIDITGPTASPIISIDPNYAGQTSINTVGPIGIGSWVATPVGTAYTVAQVIGITGSSSISVTGTQSNPFIGISSSYSGQTSINTIGNVVTGTWQATPITTAYTQAQVISLTGTSSISVTGTQSNPFIGISSSYPGQTSINTLGTITTGTWDATPITTAYTQSQVISVTGTTNIISVTGTQSNPYLSISSSYAGQTSLNTLGTITTGSWDATPINGQYLNYNTSNFKVVSNQLDTIQDITTGSSVAFGSVNASTCVLSNSLNPQISLNGKFGNFVEIYGPILGPSDSNFVVSIPNPAGLGLSTANFILDQMSQTIIGSKTFSGSTTFSSASNYLSGISSNSVIGLDASGKIVTNLTNMSPTFQNFGLSGVTNGQLIITNSSQCNYLSLNDGQIPIGTGSSVVANTITGTSNEIIVTTGSGSITLSTPQAIGTGSSPTFATVKGSTSVLSPLYDVITWGAMNIGTSTASSINIGNGTINITETGIITKPNQPLFIYELVTGVSNVTGDSTPYTIVFDTSRANIGSHFNGTTFTCPITGYYRVACTITLGGITSAMTSGYLYVAVAGTSARDWIQFINNPGASKDGNSQYTTSINYLVPMTATDTLTFIIQVFNGTKVAGTIGSVGSVQPCSCSCVLEC